MAKSRQDVVGSICVKNSKTLTQDKTFNEMQLLTVERMQCN